MEPKSDKLELPWLESESSIPDLDVPVLKSAVALKRALPFGEYEFINVSFTAADTDTRIPVTLNVRSPRHLRWVDVTPNVGAGAQIYTVSSATQFDGLLTLRCNVAGYATRLLVFSEQVATDNADGDVTLSAQNVAAPEYALVTTGTWTPSLGGNATYTGREGRYTRHGNKVTIVGFIAVNLIGTGSTSTISGVPFAEGGAQTAPIAIGFYTGLATAVVELSGYLTGTDIAISAKGAASTGIGASAVFQNGTQVDFSCTYLV